MKKKIVSLLLATVMVLSMVACGSKEEPAESPTAEVPAEEAADGEETVITVWTNGRHDLEYMTSCINAYNESNADNIYIDYQVHSDNYEQMLDLAFSTEGAPDVFLIPGNNLINVLDKGYPMDIAPYITEEYEARFGENAFVDGVNAMGNAIYSLPYTASAVRLFYNQDIFDRVGIEAPPKTLEELVEYASLITEQLSGEGIYGFAGNHKASHGLMRTVDPIVMVSGGTRTGYDFKNGVYDFSSYKPVLEAYEKLMKVSFPGCDSLDIDPLRTQFAEGKIAMYMSFSHAEPGVYANQFPTDINWNAAQIPTLTGENAGKQQLWVGGNYFCISNKTEHPDEAWKVMEFLHSDDVMRGYFEEGLGIVMIPTAIEGAQAPELYTKMPDLMVSENDANWPVLPTGVVVEGKDYLTVFTEVIFGLTDVDKAIEDLNQRYNEAYDKVVESGQERIVYPNFTPDGQDTSK